MAEWDADIAIDLPLVRGCLARHLPELAACPVDPFGEGWDNTAFLVDGRLVFRFPRRAAWAASLVAEARWLPVLAPRLPLPISCPVHVVGPDAAFPYLWCGYPLLPGQTLCRANLDDPARAGLAAPLGGFLRALHGAPVDDVALQHAPRDEIGRADLRGRAPRLLARLRDVQDHLQPAIRAAITREIDALAATPLHAGPLGWVHGDLYARHLIVDGAGHLAGVIDWGDLHLGDPALDLSVAFAVLPAAVRPAFWAAYGPVDPDTAARARFRALYSGVLILAYAREVGDPALIAAGERAISGGLALVSSPR